LGMWFELQENWDWFWIGTDERLCLHVNRKWQVWLPSRRTRFYGSTFVPTDTFLSVKPPNAQRAIISINGVQVIFWGARHTLAIAKPPRLDFHTFLRRHAAAEWALVNVHTPDNGKALAASLNTTRVLAVSDGSYKENLGTAAWVITNEAGTTRITGKTSIPGPPSQQCSYRSKLGGIYSTVVCVNLLCAYYSVDHGTIFLDATVWAPYNNASTDTWTLVPLSLTLTSSGLSGKRLEPRQSNGNGSMYAVIKIPT